MEDAPERVEVLLIIKNKKKIRPNAKEKLKYKGESPQLFFLVNFLNTSFEDFSCVCIGSELPLNAEYDVYSLNRALVRKLWSFYLITFLFLRGR